MIQSKLQADERGKINVPADCHPYHHRLNNAAATMNWAGYLAVCKNIINEVAKSKMPGPAARGLARCINLTGLYYFGEYRIAADAVTGEFCMPSLPKGNALKPIDTIVEKAR